MDALGQMLSNCTNLSQINLNFEYFDQYNVIHAITLYILLILFIY